MRILSSLKFFPKSKYEHKNLQFILFVAKLCDKIMLDFVWVHIVSNPQIVSSENLKFRSPKELPKVVLFGLAK